LEEHLKHEKLQAEHILSKVKEELRADPKARPILPAASFRAALQPAPTRTPTSDRRPEG
jgi:hypothetical protein